MTEIIGWIGAIAFACCGIPQAIKTRMSKSAKDLSLLFLLLWFVGEVCAIIYVIHNNIQTGVAQLPLLFNYVFNFVILIYLLYAKLMYR